MLNPSPGRRRANEEGTGIIVMPRPRLDPQPTLTWSCRSMSDPYDLKQAGVSSASWSIERILPDGFLPMLATTATGPMDSLEHMYEPKWEGLRVLVGFEGNQGFMRSGTGQD